MGILTLKSFTFSQHVCSQHPYEMVKAKANLSTKYTQLLFMVLFCFYIGSPPCPEKHHILHDSL